MSDAGDINVYAERDFNMRARGNVNIRSEKNLNLEAEMITKTLLLKTEKSFARSVKKTRL